MSAIGICDKCKCETELKLGVDGTMMCEFCRAIATARNGFENAALMNSVFLRLQDYFIPKEIEKRGPGRPKK